MTKRAVVGHAVLHAKLELGLLPLLVLFNFQYEKA